MTTRSNSCQWGQIDDVDYRIDESIEVSAVVALVRSLPVAQQVEVNGSDKLERYSHIGCLIRVVSNGRGRGGHSRALPYSVMV